MRGAVISAKQHDRIHAMHRKELTMELTYTKCGDYYIPDLAMDGGEEDCPLGKYGSLRETYLREHHHGTYTSMLLTGRLNDHLTEMTAVPTR